MLSTVMRATLLVDYVYLACMCIDWYWQTPVLQFWKAFDLDSKRLVLDTQGNAMKTEKDNSVRSRKKLAETTKAFRKLPDSDKVHGIGGLLRAYQEEIDNLTKRAKYSENAFFMLYKGLFAAPDPVPSLEAIADMKIQETEDENRRLKRELKEYELEFASLKNQDITIRNLEDQVAKFEQDMDNMVHERVTLQCRELDEQLALKAAELAQQKVDFERQLETSRSELRDAFRRMDAMQSDLFAYKQQSGRAKNALDAELEMMVSQDTIVTQTLQLENTQLKKQLEDLLSVAGGDALSSNSSMPLALSSSSASVDAAVEERDATIRKLRQEVFALKEAVGNANGHVLQERERHEAALSETNRRVDELTMQLAARPTLEKYNDVLHQLRVLQQLEYNIVDEDDDENEADTRLSMTSASSSTADAATTETEKILVSRVRRLAHSLQQSELLVQQRTAALSQVQDELQQKRDVIQEQAVLLRNLEEHVATLESRKSKSIHTNNTDVGTEILLDAMEDQLKTSISGGPIIASALTTPSTAAAEGVDASDFKMLEIVRGQRDRFRERMKELQSEKSKLEELANSYKASVTRLENDNMQLYHKIRYLQSYRNENGRNGVGANHRVTPSYNNNFSNLEDGNGGAGGDVEAKYKSLYEEKMNPFVQFNNLERQQRYTNLNTVDKILLNSARLFLGHRITRNIAFGYVLLLHFLVFATLYSFMHGCGVTNTKRAKAREAKRMRWQTLGKVALWVPVGVAVNSLVVGVASVKGRSMQPTLNGGMRENAVRDRVLLDKFSVQMRHQFTRGDVVVLASPSVPGELLIKRLVALEGDLITDRSGRRVLIPAGKCWIEGDNPACSDDSNDAFGPVPLALINARVLAVVWPLNQMKLVKSELPQEINRVNV
ncbi:Casp-like protein, partial [Globisporangium splendens]